MSPRSPRDNHSDFEADMDLDQEAEQLRVIAMAHKENSLVNCLSELQTTRQYQQKVEFLIPLNDLYELMASCMHTEGSNFCGTLVKIVDPTILALNNGLPFLLQVWKRGGQLLFEKSMRRPVANWNIKKDKFLFQED